MTRVSRRTVADAIRLRIQDGEWGPGEQVPSTKEFAEQYRIGVRTASEALGILVEQGVLIPRNGVGRYVPSEQDTTDT